MEDNDDRQEQEPDREPRSGRPEPLQQPELSPDERAKLEKEVNEYGSMWPVFLILGVVFSTFGLQQGAIYYGVGVAFFASAIAWYYTADKAKKKLAAHTNGATSGGQST